MSRRRAGLIAPALLLLTASCADEKRDREIACQQRLVEASGDIRAVRGADRTIIAPTFARLSKRYDDLALDGCSENQAHSAKTLARLAGELARSAGAAESALEGREPGLEEQRAILIFTDALERLEKRRAVLREELAGMTADRR